MKAFLKIFAIAFVSFALAMGAGLWSYSKFYVPSLDQNELTEANGSNVDIIDTVEAQEPAPEVEKSEFEKLIEESKRVNVLLLGMEGPRSDTIVLASFDPDQKKVDLISIPRDTYYPRKGYNTADKKKLNAVYGDSGVEGTMEAVGQLMGGIPVHHYVKVTYAGVERIIDSLGGVKVNVPFDMVYDDPYDTPPLHINIPKGNQVLKGKNAVHFLRFRSGYPDGDLGRIRAQQKFMKAAIGKVFSFRLPVVANTVFKHVKTDMTLSEILVYAGDAVGMSLENVETHGLPGKATEKGVSYFLHDVDAAKQLVTEIYTTEVQE